MCILDCAGCSLLQWVAVCCSVCELQSAVVGCSVLQWILFRIESRTIENTHHFLTLYTHVGGAGAQGHGAQSKI